MHGGGQGHIQNMTDCRHADACEHCRERIDDLRIRAKSILGERDHWKHHIETMKSLATEVAVALGVESLKGEDQYRAALKEIERLKAAAGYGP